MEDARTHDLLRAHPAIAEFGAVGYAGVPLIAAEGEALGTFRVIDSRPRRWTERELTLVSELARAALVELELRRMLHSVRRGQAERLVAERRQALAELSPGLRHEANNALGGLLLCSDLLDREGGDPDAQREILTTLRLQALRIAGAIDRLGDVDRLRVASYLDGQTMTDVSGTFAPGSP